MGKGPPFGLEPVLGKIWVSHGPNGQFELQKAKIWFQKAPGQDLAQKGFLPRFPEANFNSQLASPNCPNLAPKGSWPGFGPERPSPKVPRSKFQQPAGKPQIAHICLQKAPWLGFGPEGLFPKVSRSKFEHVSVPSSLRPVTGVAHRKPQGLGSNWLCHRGSPPQIPRFGFKLVLPKVWPRRWTGVAHRKSQGLGPQ